MSSSEGVVLVSGPTQWVNAERTVLVSLWRDGTMAVALRDTPGEIWGPPITVRPEQ